MKTKYDLVNRDSVLPVIVKLAKNKIGSLFTILRDIEIYEAFMALDCGYEIRYDILAEKFPLSRSSIKRIIIELSKPIE